VEITVSEMMKGNITLIDIRSKYQYLEGSIPNSINIVENMLLLNPERYLNRSKEYVIFCDYGNRSKRVSNYLNNIGYRVYSLSGGYNSYINK